MDRCQSCASRADPEIALPILVEEAHPILRQTVALVEMNRRSAVFENQIQPRINGSQCERAVTEFEAAGDGATRPRILPPIFRPLSVLPPAYSLIGTYEPGPAT